MKVGIFGGSFNPVHNEHVLIAENAVKELGLDKLFIMPTFIAPHKDCVALSPSLRLEMLRLAFKGKDKIEISDFEIKNGGKSYSYITAEYFKEKYGEVYMIVGGDMLTDFKSWKYPERILNAVTLCAFDREDFTTDYQAEHEYFKKNFGKDFVKLNYIGKKQSSTKIRVYSMLSLDISYMTDKKVAEFIKEKGVYKGNEYFEYAKSVLPVNRLTHTANVIVCALKKAKELGLDSERVQNACVLHDIAKYQKKEDYPDFKLPKDVPEPVVHAFLGAYIAETVLKVDGEIADAIRYHTSGKAKMSTLSKLLLVADMIEEGRDYEGVENLRSIYEKDFYECFRECLKEEIMHLEKKNTPIYIETINAYEYYKTKGEKV